MKFYFFFTILIVNINNVLFAQKDRTSGKSSPIINGVKAKIDYISSSTTELQIPVKLATYLTGILLTNKISSDSKSIDKALSVWINKYKELKLQINNIADKPLRDKLLYSLDQGDFTFIESNLLSKTNYGALYKTFPSTYQTSGNQSPIIIGDFATVTYVVNQVVNVNLDEAAVANIMKDVKKKEAIIGQQNSNLNNLKSLSIEIPSLDENVRNYITSYKLIASELKKIPAAEYKKANAFFIKGDYKRVLQILESSAKTTNIDFARLQLLKAKILLLQINYEAYDSTIIEINKAFLTALQILPTTKNSIEYGRFLVDQMNDYTTAIPYFEKSLDSIKGMTEKAEVYNYLSQAYGRVDRLKSVNYLFKGLDILIPGEQKADSGTLKLKAKILLNLSLVFSTSQLDPQGNNSQLTKAIVYIDSAITTINKITNAGENENYLLAICFTVKGNLHSFFGDTINAFNSYSNASQILERLFSIKPSQYAYNLSLVYYNLAALTYTFAKYNQAILYLAKAREIVEPRASINTKALIFWNIKICLSIYTNLEALNETYKIKKLLFELKKFIYPFLKQDQKDFEILNQSFSSNLGYIYMNENSLDSAEYYISSSYEYFYENISIIQFDKSKVSQIIKLKNRLLIEKHKYEEATAFNFALLSKFKSIVEFSTQYYDDFIPQLYSQLAEIYLANNTFDSSIYYSDLALNIMFYKASKNGGSYYTNLNECILQSCSIRMQQDNLLMADSLALNYIEWLSIDKTMDLFIKEKAQVQVGNDILKVADLFATYMDTIAGIDSLKYFREQLFLNINKYFEHAENHYKYALLKFPTVSYRYCVYLLKYSNFLEKWSSSCLEKDKMKKYTEKTCSLLILANSLSSLLDFNPVSEDLKLKIKKNFSKCE